MEKDQCYLKVTKSKTWASDTPAPLCNEFPFLDNIELYKRSLISLQLIGKCIGNCVGKSDMGRLGYMKRQYFLFHLNSLVHSVFLLQTHPNQLSRLICLICDSKDNS